MFGSECDVSGCVRVCVCARARALQQALVQEQLVNSLQWRLNLTPINTFILNI